MISASIQPAIWNSAMKKPILYIRNEPAVITKASEVAREKPSRIAISNRDSAGNKYSGVLAGTSAEALFAVTTAVEQ
jgi:hypothetical protein